jgi:hypothetical protein
MSVKVPAGAKEQSISAVVTRSDGTVEDLGVISYWHKNPFKRWAWAIKHCFSTPSVHSYVSDRVFDGKRPIPPAIAARLHERRQKNDDSRRST